MFWGTFLDFDNWGKVMRGMAGLDNRLMGVSSFFFIGPNFFALEDSPEVSFSTLMADSIISLNIARSEKFFVAFPTSLS